jgi:methionyl-tRNA formyltransferase
VIARPGPSPLRPRIVLLGTASAYTHAALRTLSARGHPPVAVIRPRRVPGVPGVREVRPPPGAAEPLPVYEAGSLEHAEAVRLRERMAPELVVAACHPHRVPPAWLDAPALGGWNIHPSLLPAYRGPVPVFWQLRAGEARTGVTVHRMDQGFDSGPVLAQRAVPFPEGARSDELDTLLAATGAGLVADLLARAEVTGAPQDEQRATQQGFPSDEDLELDAAWPARRAFDFLRGAEAWGPFRVSLGSHTLLVEQALALHAAAPAAPGDGEALIEFSGGTVSVRLAR